MLVLLVLLGMPSAGSSIEPGFTVRSWDNENGLPQARLTSLARTPDGYLWIGSDAGLVRFDGDRFVTLTTNDVPALGDNRISSLVVDTNGALWISTLGGTLAVREGAVFRSVSLDPRLRGTAISHLSSGPDGALWLANDRFGPVRWRSGVCAFPFPTNGLPAGPANSLIWDVDNRPWLLKQISYLYSLGDGSWQRQLFDLKNDERIYVMTPAGRTGSAWLAVSAPHWSLKRGARVFRMEAGRLVQELTPYPWAQDSASRIHSMIEDRRGRLWVGTHSAGLYLWEPGRQWRKVEAREFPTWNQISTLSADEDGLIWAVNDDGSLCCIAEQKVANLPLPEPFNHQIISSVCVRRNGQVWAGTLNAGIFRLQGDVLVQITNGLDTVQIGTVFEDSRTNLWVGAWGGLYRWDGHAFSLVLGAKDPLWMVLALCEDRRGNLWVSSDRGVFRFSPDGEVRRVGEAVGRDVTLSRAIAEDAHGRMYLAAPNEHGLYRLVGGDFERVPHNQDLDLSTMHGLYPDEDGGLWITTEGAGLMRFKDGQFRRWTTSDGLPDMFLRTAIADLDGNLWFGSNRGIFGCTRDSLESHLRARGSPILFWRLSVAEGLRGKLTSGAGQPVASRSADGRLWFPNQHSIASFDPAEVRLRGRAFSPVIEEVLVDGLPESPGPDGGLRLASGVRRLGFRYTCADLRAPELLQFRYRLEGVDEGWMDAGSQRTASYIRIPPGSYRFRVMAGGAAGEWREAGQTVSITIVPRLWERGSVRLAVALILLGSLAAAVWSIGRARIRRKLARVREERAVAQERQRIAADIHDDLGASLTRITLLSDMAREGAMAGGVAAEMDQIYSTSRELTRSMDEIVWAVNPEHDTLDSLVTYLGKFAQDLLRAANVRCRLQFPPTVPAIDLNSHVRHNLFLAVKEALNNVVKHSAATEARLQFILEPKAFVLVVSDNGSGFDHGGPSPGQQEPDPLRISRGHGLRNIFRRLGEVGGRCEVVSAPGQGTEIRLCVPLPPAHK